MFSPVAPNAQAIGFEYPGYIPPNVLVVWVSLKTQSSKSCKSEFREFYSLAERECLVHFAPCFMLFSLGKYVGHPSPWSGDM